MRIRVSIEDESYSEFSRDVTVTMDVEPEAHIRRIANQLTDAVKAVLVAASYSEENVAELFDGVHFDETA